MLIRKFGPSFAGFALLLPACDAPCPSQPSVCSSSATLRFVLEDGAPQAYELRIRTVENGVEEEDRCLVIAPLPSDWPTRSFTGACVRNSVSLQVQPVLATGCTPHVTPTPDGIGVGSECNTTVTHHELLLYRRSQPEVLEIQAIRGDESFAPLTVTPQYADFYPDGEHCSTRCPVADEQRSFTELTLPVDASSRGAVE